MALLFILAAFFYKHWAGMAVFSMLAGWGAGQAIRDIHEWIDRKFIIRNVESYQKANLECLLNSHRFIEMSKRKF